MRWTGEDILAQLDEGWELEEIAAATGMGIAEVKRLIREQRYKNRTPAKVETMTTTKQEETTQAEHPEWEWSSIRTLSMLPGAPPYGTLQYRFRSGTAQWAHYETAKPGDLEGVEADPRAKTLGRLTPGTTWEPLEADQNEQPTESDEAPEREAAKESAKIATLETALITAREEAANHEATIERLVKERDALEKIGDVVERHTAFGADELNAGDMCELLEAAFVDASKLPSVRGELERVSENLLAVHRECERRGYGADDKRPAVEKVHDIIDYAEELEHLVARQDQRIKELESKRELTIEETDTPEHHECGEDEAGGTIAQWLDRLADLENEIATAYALRSTEDFADPDDRCWDLEHATKHVRRWQEVVEEQDIEAGR